MSSSLGSLVKDTAWYGFSTIVGRLLNWLLVPFYVRILHTTGEYGIVTNVYAWIALLLVLLTYGLETGFFYFVNRSDHPSGVYKLCLRSLAVTSILFSIGAVFFSVPLSRWMLGVELPYAIIMMALIVASDAFMSLPYAYLRFTKQAKRFALIKLSFVALNIGLNLFFLLLCPYLMLHAPATVGWFYVEDFGIGYIFLSNLLANGVIFMLLLPAMRHARGSTPKGTLFALLRYSLPLMLLGIVGIFNQMADKILFPFLYSDKEKALSELGIYGGCFKIAVLMVLFTQAFRYAFEPFFFEKGDGGNDSEAQKKRNLATVMKYFWVFLLFIFLGVMAFIDLLKYFVVPDYYAGLYIVPWVMWGEMMMGVALNLSTWYKLTGKTSFGALISIVGCFVGVALIVFGVPIYGFKACAWAIAISNTFIVVHSYLLGQRYYPVKYHLLHALSYLLLAALGYMLIYWSNHHLVAIGKWSANILVVVAYALLVFLPDRNLRNHCSKIWTRIISL